MKLGVAKESKENEKRVALTPDVVKTLVKKDFEILIEEEAGLASGFSDEMYEKSGAHLTSKEGIHQAQVILRVNPPTLEEAEMMQNESVSLSFLYAYLHPELLSVFNKKKISAFAMDAVPRISRAQRMDALSSQSNLAGYKAVIMAANHLHKIFPLMMTAAGTITPAKVLIFGAGVAGLQAIATAKRLGAVVEVTDVRPETKEQVESLGGRFISVENTDEIKTEGGYAKEVSKEFLVRQQQLVQEKIKDADIVITTALVMGKKSPVLVTEKMVKTMKPGSVIVDMAVESGGNCELSEYNKTVRKHEVLIIGESNYPSLLSQNASQLYAANISTLLLHLASHQGFKWDHEEEITSGSLITHQGEIVHEFTKSILNQ
ncbi:MAG TPA: Re/Si-specific NAD(P)(+) transhydrogenase subunit alpha [Sphingobacterium sp.]|nr:Re/Si-specific NAD(P)(+) transhydrogenase subunit alpha [Sphingobacterium sp.]